MRSARSPHSCTRRGLAFSTSRGTCSALAAAACSTPARRSRASTDRRIRLRAVRRGYRADTRRDGGGHLHRQPRVRQIAAHDPDSLPVVEYFRQIFWSSGIDLPEKTLEQLIEEITIDVDRAPAGRKALLSLQLPADFVIVFDPVTHAHAIHRRQGRADARAPALVARLQRCAAHRPARSSCGPGRCGCRSKTRPTAACCRALWIASDALHDCWASAGRS